MAAGFYHWIEAGKLHAANKAELGPRRWAPWCRDHEISATSADYLISIAERFDPILPTVGKIDGLQIDLQALRALASPTAPVTAAVEAVKKASDGEHITKMKAQKLIDKARQEAKTAAAQEAQARFDEQAAKLADEMRGYEIAISAKDLEIAELKLAAANARQEERERQEARVKGMLVVSEVELKATVERLTEPMQQAAEKAQQARDKALQERDRVRAKLDRIYKEQEAAKAAATDRVKLPPLDGDLQFRSIGLRGAIGNCVRYLTLTPAEMIINEIEFSTRLHNDPAIARSQAGRGRGRHQTIVRVVSNIPRASR